MALSEILDAVSALGTLGFALIAVYAFLTERVVPRGRLDELRADHKEAIDLARTAAEGVKRLADAIEAGNRLDAAKEQVDAERRRER